MDYYVLYYIMTEDFDNISFFDKSYNTLDEAMEDFKDFKTINKSKLGDNNIKK